MTIDPMIRSKREMNLTEIMTTCSTLVFSMLLNEKAPPAIKKTASQN